MFDEDLEEGLIVSFIISSISSTHSIATICFGGTMLRRDRRTISRNEEASAHLLFTLRTQTWSIGKR